MGTFYHEMQVFSATGDRSETVDALVTPERPTPKLP